MRLFTTLFAFLLVCGTGLLAQAPTVETIVDNYLEAIGGADSWRSLKSMKMSGEASMQGMTFPFTMITAEGDKMRQVVDVQGQQMIQAYDGKDAWMVAPFMGMTEPTPMPKEQAAEMKEERFLPEFIDAEERGFKIEAVEGKELEGTPTYGLRVTTEEGFDRTYYFDQEYFIPIMMASKVKEGPQAGTVMETYLSDYQEVEGIVVPMFMEVKVSGATMQKISIKEAALNVEVNDEMFAMPKPAMKEDGQ